MPDHIQVDALSLISNLNTSADVIFIDIDGTIVEDSHLWNNIGADRQTFLNAYIQSRSEYSKCHWKEARAQLHEVVHYSKYYDKKPSEAGIAETIKKLQKKHAVVALTSGMPSLYKKNQLNINNIKLYTVFSKRRSKGECIKGILKVLCDDYNVHVKSIAVIDNHANKLHTVADAFKNNEKVKVQLYLYTPPRKEISKELYQKYCLNICRDTVFNDRYKSLYTQKKKCLKEYEIEKPKIINYIANNMKAKYKNTAKEKC